MWTRLGVAMAVVLASASFGAVVGCSLAAPSSAGTQNAITGSKFDKNHLIDDDVLMDDKAVTAQQIQTFLDRTPYGTQSPLANYRDENGAPAAELLHDAAVSYGVNPITLLVRIEMENGLISAPAGPAVDGDASADSGLETPTSTGVETKIQSAFNCGRILGLDAQAGCATRAVARAMMLLEGGQEANGGWKRGAALKTQDKITVTPVNAATAAIYVYTPYIGEAAGGTKGVAGAAGHMGLWNVFAKALKYKGATCPADASGCATDDDGGSASDDGGAVDIDAGDPDASDIDAGELDAGTHDAATHDGGRVIDAGDVDAGEDPPPPSDAGPSGSGKDAGKKDAATPDPTDEGDDGSGHKTPSAGTGGTGNPSGDYPADPASADGDDAGDGTGGAAKKGCSATGAGTGDVGSFALLVGLAAITARRRRSALASRAR